MKQKNHTDTWTAQKKAHQAIKKEKKERETSHQKRNRHPGYFIPLIF